jgi:hypothetical protein
VITRPPLHGSVTRPAGLTRGPGHVVIHGNPAFLRVFGERSVGLPARECMLGLPPEAFALLDAVIGLGRPAARWVELDGETWRMTVVPRADPGTTEPYGLAFHLRARSDLPIVADPNADPNARSPAA